uniref:Uncharacterized protein n=1 Tax=Siphoviridae sp. ctxMM9 TaxID=2827973 RepID=A0A8S5T6C2_9CAUD|nr:MAG TPA: hypothetical protein [Siphoviridae sp. ctxMM9]
MLRVINRFSSVNSKVAIVQNSLLPELVWLVSTKSSSLADRNTLKCQQALLVELLRLDLKSSLMVVLIGAKSLRSFMKVWMN